MDIAVYKCISNDRLEEVKAETYGKRSYYKYDSKQNWKLSIILLMNMFG